MGREVTVVTTAEALRAIVGHPNAAVVDKVKPRLSPVQRDWLAHSPLGFVASTDADGRGDTLRINGSARVVADADYFDAMVVDGKRPILALEIAVEEVFFHCAKAFLRSDAWKPETWDPTAVPSAAELVKAIYRDTSMEELKTHFDEDDMRAALY